MQKNPKNPENYKKILKIKFYSVKLITLETQVLDYV